VDKQRRKELKKEYLKQELLKQAQDDNEILANWAKRKLGIPLPKLDRDYLSQITDYDLIEKIYYKIEEQISFRKRTERRKDELSIIEELPIELKLVYYSYFLDTDIWEGGFEDYYENTAGEHILDTIQVFKVLNDKSIIELLEKSVGVFLKLIDSGFDLWMGDIKTWQKKASTIDKDYYLNISNNYDFERLDNEYKEIKLKFKDMIVKYIRMNIEKFEI
jgi:hypothetical protein